VLVPALRVRRDWMAPIIRSRFSDDETSALTRFKIVSSNVCKLGSLRGRALRLNDDAYVHC